MDHQVRILCFMFYDVKGKGHVKARIVHYDLYISLFIELLGTGNSLQ